MSKTTAASVETNLPAALNRFKESASAVKAAHVSARQAIKQDPMTSDLAKKQKLEALDQATKIELGRIRGEQDSHVENLRNKIERELRGDQPTDANSVLLRRDAADRARRVQDKTEALAVLNDAIANGDESMAHAVGAKARNNAWLDVAEAYQGAYPSTADSAAALAYVECVASGPAYNLSNGITYSAPVTD